MVQTELIEDTKNMKKDFNKLVKKHLKMGSTQEKAEEQARSLINYYKHTYKLYN